MFSAISSGDIPSLVGQLPRSGPIDYFEIALPSQVRFSSEFDAVRGGARTFDRTEDLTRIGWPLVLRHPPRGARKDAPIPLILRINRVGEMSAAEIVELLDRILRDQDPFSLVLRRIDFKVDLVNGPTVEEFRQSTRFRRKRKGLEYASQTTGDAAESLCHTWGKVETLSWGDVRRDAIKIYNKAEQVKEVFPSLSIGDAGNNWVRIERLLVGQRIPEHLRTIGGLFSNGPYFDPFGDLEIAPVSGIQKSAILCANLSEQSKMNALYVWALIDEHGRAEALRTLRRKHKRKVKAMFAFFDSIADGVTKMPTNGGIDISVPGVISGFPP